MDFLMIMKEDFINYEIIIMHNKKNYFLMIFMSFE